MSTIVNKFGTMQGWNAVTANILGRDLEGIVELAYDDKEKKENVYGAGKFPIGRGRGNYEPKASISILKEEIDAMKNSLEKGKSIRDIAPFDMVVQYETENGIILKDRIRNCEFMGDGVEVKQNDMTITTKYELLISHIEWNVI